MKTRHLFPLLAILTLGSCNPSSNQRNEIALGDTIQTQSGLQYFYLKHGEGRIIEAGSEVGTYLSLQVNDSVVWTTDELPDSLFTFIAGYTRLITGFVEAYWLLREGDEIIAILPDSLAYGAKGAGDVIPPHSTLIYDQFKIVKVGEPKGILADTLFEIFETKGIKTMLEKYKHITSSKDSNMYYIQNDQLYSLNRKLNNESKYKEAADVAALFAEITGDIHLKYLMVLSYEKSGQIKLAIDNLKILNKIEPTNENYSSKLAEIMEKYPKI